MYINLHYLYAKYNNALFFELSLNSRLSAYFSHNCPWNSIRGRQIFTTWTWTRWWWSNKMDSIADPNKQKRGKLLHHLATENHFPSSSCSLFLKVSPANEEECFLLPSALSSFRSSWQTSMDTVVERYYHPLHLRLHHLHPHCQIRMCCLGCHINESWACWGPSW